MSVSVLVEDIATGLLLDEIPFVEVSWSRTLNDSSSWSLTLPQGHEATDLFEPARRLVHVDLNGRVIYSGVYWSSQHVDGVSTYAGSDLFSWMQGEHRVYRGAIVIDHPTPVDQFQLVQEIYNCAIFDGGLIGLQLRLNQPTTGITRIVTYSPYDRKAYGEMIADLAEAANGFEWQITSERSGNSVVRYLDISYPRIGQVVPITWEDGYDVNLTRHTVDGSRIANRMDVFGAGDSSSKLIGISQIVPPPEGYHRLDGQLSRTDVGNQAYLNALAGGEIARRVVPAETAQVQLLDTATLGEWNPGDELFLSSDRYRLFGSFRVTSYNAKQGEAGLEVNVDLAKGLPLGKPVRTPYEQMVADEREITRRIRSMEGS